MITRKEVMETVLQGKGALDTGNGDVGYLRFLVNKMTYELAQGILVGELEGPIGVQRYSGDFGSVMD
jgi:hypothetical protein